MFDSSSFEYVIHPPRRVVRRRLALFVSLYALAAFAVFAGFCALWLSDPTAATGVLIPYFTVAVLVLGTAILLTRCFVRYEYEISLVGGELSLCKIFGGSIRRRLISLRFSAVILAGHADGRHEEQIRRYAPDITYPYALYPDAPDAFFLLFENEDERRCLLLFDSTPDARRAMRNANPAAVKLS